MRIRVGDNVIVIAGADKGRVGVVTATFPKEDKVVVEGVNVRTLHIKPSQSNPDGGIEKIEKPIHVSNVMINVGDVKDASKAKATKIAYKYEQNKNGKRDKTRIAKVNGEKI